MAPFFKIFWLFVKQTWFTFNGACNAFQKASKAHLIIILLVIFLTCYTKPYLFLPVDYVLVSHWLPASQIFHAGCTCQPLKGPTCSSDDIVCFCPPCLAFSLMPVFHSSSWDVLFPREIKNTLLESRPGWTKKNILTCLACLVLCGVIHKNLSPSERHSDVLDCIYSDNPARCLAPYEWADSYVIPPLNV